MEYIILQPMQTRNKGSNVSLVQRQSSLTPEEERLVLHEAGGPFSGFVVKKLLPLHMQQHSALVTSAAKCDLSFRLNVFMRHHHKPAAEASSASIVNESSMSSIQQEQRTIEFWFATNASQAERMTCSNSFFHNLFKGDNFPKDYFMFLLRIMQIFKALKPIVQLRIDIEQIGPLPSTTAAAAAAAAVSALHASDDDNDDNGDGANNSTGAASVVEPRQRVANVTAKILEFLERAFPNAIAVDELARLTDSSANMVFELLKQLLDRGLVNYYDNGKTWIRNIINSQDEMSHEVIMINQQPTVANSDQPSIAIITVNYYEKLAVDAMMSNKVTFVRHKPEGESNVYTIGNIGEHRVVSTKLPLLGRDTRSAKISSGNTTTRLLGIFQKVEHVLLVGCGGGVPHYSDAARHPRRGDIVVSFPDDNAGGDDNDDEAATDYVYAHFETQSDLTRTHLVSKSWMPESMQLYKIVNDIRRTYNPAATGFTYPWEEYLADGIRSLYTSELDCRRPADDKLFLNVGDKNIVEVNHPEDAIGGGGGRRRPHGLPMLRFGKIAGGERVVRDEQLRHVLSEQHGIVCFDGDMDQVMESIEGNRKESFMLIRGICDYSDGSTSKEWQPYAALCAAAFAKTVICALPSPSAAAAATSSTVPVPTTTSTMAKRIVR